MTFFCIVVFFYHGHVNLTIKQFNFLCSICVNQVLIIHNLNELFTVINVFSRFIKFVLKMMFLGKFKTMW